MVAIVCSRDGIHLRAWNVSTNETTIDRGWFQSLGDYTGRSGATLQQTVPVGYDAFLTQKFNPCFQFDALAINSSDSIEEAFLTIYLDRAYRYVQFDVKAYADPDTPEPSNSFSSDYQAYGSSTTQYISQSDQNQGNDYWNPISDPVAIDVTSHLRELISHPNWSSGKRAVFVLRSYDYDVDDNNGLFYIHSTENPTANAARLVYEITVVPTITTVGGDDKILADESNVVITGTNLAGASALRIYKGSNSYPQTISTTSATEIQFNSAGNIPTGTGYTLEVTVDTATVTRTVEIEEEVIIVENVTAGDAALTAVDGHEYVDTGTGFPGTWETKSSVTSTTYFTDGIMVGRWDGNDFKTSIKIGPLAINNSDVLFIAELNLNVIQNYKYNNIKIQAVANPDAADIGTGNIISSQSLTTATATTSTSTWGNSASIGYWVQTVNPKNIDVTAIAQEVINHANWSSGDYIQFVIDFVDDLSGLQGMTRLGTNDDSAINGSTFSFSVDDGVTITSVSGDDVIELGELNCTIVGKNLASASNLNINKGGISENQTITSNTDVNITFDVTTGAIVADTGYTIQFDVGGTTYTHTVEFVTGGGVNTGSTAQSLDGYEDTITNTWYDEYLTQNVNIIGYSPFLPAQRGTAIAKIGPIVAQRAQTITTADLTWACSWALYGAFKGFIFRIYAVANPAAADVGSGNLPNSQSLTTAYVEIDTTTWAGYSPTTYWVPGAEVIDVSSVVQEVVNNANWSTGRSVQLIFQPQSYPSGDAGVSFNSTESGGTLLSLSFATSAATNIASINGTNEIRVGDTGIKLLGNDLASATSLSITDGAYTESQTILSNTATEITFDFAQGQLGYTASAILTVTKGGIPYTFGCTLLPGAGRSYVVAGTPGTGDNALTYNEAPELTSGDIIDYLSVSANGFTVSVSNTGVPTIQGGIDQDTFTAKAYIASTGTWYDLQTITFLPASYFVRNTVPLLEFGSTIGAGVVVSSGDFTNTPAPEPGEPPLQDVSETWTVQNDTDDTESWT